MKFLSKVLERKEKFTFPFLLWLAISTLATITGPFGTYQSISIGDRCVYWFTLVGLAILTSRLLRAIVVPRLSRWQTARRDVVIVMLMVPTMTLIVVSLSPWLLGVSADEFPSTITIASYVLLVGLVIYAIRRVILPNEAPRSQQAELPRLAERLPEKDRAEILRLSSRGHMVDVITTQGTTSLRIRLADAIREMEPVLGYCTHRSHWVTRAGIAGVEHGPAGKVALRLVNGDLVPVSRKYRAELEAVGVIETGNAA